MTIRRLIGVIDSKCRWFEYPFNISPAICSFRVERVQGSQQGRQSDEISNESIQTIDWSGSEGKRREEKMGNSVKLTELQQDTMPPYNHNINNGDTNINHYTS